MVDYKLFIEELTKRKNDLPGELSQLKMSSRPGSLNLKKFNIPEGKSRESGVLALFYQISGEIYFPLIQRPSYKGAHSGQVSFPGGKREKEDETILDTALREAKEEIGLNIHSVAVLGTLTNLFVPISNHIVTPVVGFAKEQVQFIKDDREVAEILEIRLIDFMNESNRREKLLKVSDYEINAPYFALNGKVVWGATAMMLSELYDLIKLTKLF